MTRLPDRAEGRSVQGPDERPRARRHSPSVTEIVARVRHVARGHGYAIGVHGSLVRDVDLIAAPWIERASAPDELATAIADELGGAVRARARRAHGRIGYVVLIPGGKHPNYIDLSVMAPSHA